MDYILEAIGFGLLVSVSAGPILFAIVQSALKGGFRAGFMVCMGILLSDILIILTCYWGINQISDLINTDSFKMLFYSISSIVIIIFGFILFFRQPPSLAELQVVPKKNKTLYRQFFKGFLINTLNPFGLLYWTTVMTSAMTNHSFSKTQLLIYFSIIIAVIGLTDSLKAYFAHTIRHKLQPKHIQNFSRIAGVVVVGIGIFMVVQAFS